MINDRHARWLTVRGIDPEFASRFGLHTAPDGALAFPYLEYDREVATKFRGPGKKFWQQPGGRRTFWNADILDDPALAAGTHALVITEGELDALTAIQCGFPFTVSVPDGAPPGTEDKRETPADALEDRDGKFQFMWNNRDRLKRVKRFILAVDGDGPGQRLAQELVIRLGPARCSFVSYPEGCKDLNDVLQAHGPEAVAGVINTAKPYPIKGLYRLSEFPDAPPLTGYSTGFKALDPDFNASSPGFLLYPGAFMVVSGLAYAGKSAFTTQIAFNMARLHGWHVCLASFEMRVKPIIESMLVGFYLLDKPKALRTRDDARAARDFIEEHFTFIALAPEDDETEADIDWVLDRATDSVMRHATRMLVVDPWNEVEHKRRPGETVADYTSRAIRHMKRFAHTYNVCTTVVAHPTKEAFKIVRNDEPMSLYDISDGATWANKSEVGVILQRSNPTDTLTQVGIRKVKFHETGRVGDVFMTFDKDRRAFREGD